MSLFKKRLEKAVSEVKKTLKTDMSPDSIFQEIESYKQRYDRLLLPTVWEDEILSLKIDEFDMLLTMYEALYSRVSTSLEKKGLRIWRNDDRPFEIAAVYLLRFMVQDIVSLRNLCAMKFENQFNTIFRNFIEKTDVFFLFMYDYEFSKTATFNEGRLSSKQLYHSVLSRKKIKKRIQNNLDSILRKEKEEGKSYLRLDKEAYSFLQNETIKDTYDLLSLFTHTNNISGIAKYYLEEDKFNYTLRHNESNYLHYRLDYSIEWILLLFNLFESAFNSKGVKRDTGALSNLDLGYFSVLIEEKYKRQGK